LVVPPPHTTKLTNTKIVNNKNKYIQGSTYLSP
jgi:hypothetical protein